MRRARVARAENPCFLCAMAERGSEREGSPTGRCVEAPGVPVGREGDCISMVMNVLGAAD
jgi:hypothetical protein